MKRCIEKRNRFFKKQRHFVTFILNSVIINDLQSDKTESLCHSLCHFITNIRMHEKELSAVLFSLQQVEAK